jgi:hypothetical protein
MDTSLHTHIISLHIQERIAFAERERLARELKRDRKPRTFLFQLPRRTAPTPRRKVGAGPA